jgi:hypothetical protein
MPDRSDATVVTWNPAGRSKRRLVFEPVSSGGYNRVEQVYARGAWRTVGGERVDSVRTENADLVAE